MNEVIINGVRYTPEAALDSVGGPRVGVGITTRDRGDVAAKALVEVMRLTPNALIVVVDDASAKPFEAPDGEMILVHRFEQNVGIARAKNKALEVLYDAGVEHFYLFDDDTYPLVPNWWWPYAESPEPHLMYVFQEFAGKGAPKLNDCVVLREETGLVGYSTPRGVMLYCHRSVLDIAGGMDPGFGKWGYEHGDWSNRIHAFGLTTMRYGDVPGSNQLIYSMDEHVHELSGHERSVPTAERKALLAPNRERHDRQYNKPIRYEFREPRDVVLTAYHSGVVDAQRKTAWKADPKAVEPLLSSLASRGVESVLFANEIEADVQVSTPQSPYFDRWLHFYRYLRDHPEIRYAWCVDSTDVVMLHDPFPTMEPGVLYVGSEQAVIGIKWMIDNHPEYREWINDHATDLLLNCGLVGGDRETVMKLCHRMVREFYDHRGKGVTLALDMGAFNYVARGFKCATGPLIHTVFRAKDHTNKHAWWAHK